MSNKLILIFAALITFISLSTQAYESKENIYLQQMINQLEVLKMLAVAAEKEQPENLRIQFHYRGYKDPYGKYHQGLIDDINEIEKGIHAKLNSSIQEPHHLATIKGDYVD